MIRPQKHRWIIAGAVITAAGLLYLWLFTATLGSLKEAARSHAKIESQLTDYRSTIAQLRPEDAQKIFIKESKISGVIDALTHHKKAENLRFVSITPQKIKPEPDENYRIQPIRIVIVSGYRELGIFLGSLEEMGGGTIKLEEFNIEANTPDGGDLKADLLLNLYLSNL